MFTTIIALGVIALQLAIVGFVILWIVKSPILQKIHHYSNIALPVLFIGAALSSLVYEIVFGFEPCLLCWYQRIAIFGVGIISLTGDIRSNKTIQKQIFIFSVLGLAVSIFHNYIDIFPSGLDVCGTGVSCLKRYIYEFGYITIPMASLTVLLSGVLLSLFAWKNTQGSNSLK